MTRFLVLVAVALASALLIGLLAPACLLAAVGSLVPSTSEMTDGELYFPIICLLYLVGPMAAGLSANRIYAAISHRLPLRAVSGERGAREEAIAAALLATVLSWFLILQGSVYSILP